MRSFVCCFTAAVALCLAPACGGSSSRQDPLELGTACSSSAACASGQCVDGVCCESACEGTCQACSEAKTGHANGTCAAVPNLQDPDDECEQTAATCATGTCDGGGACKIAQNGEVCRLAAGTCDEEELCDNNTCPADAFKPSATECRAAAGDCDLAESCSGASANCPPDAVKAAGSAVCRPAGGDCDPAESCDGLGPVCPGDALAPPTAVCRAARGACDLAETCTGSSSACPADQRVGASVVCRPAAGACDLSESCTGNADDCPADQFSSGNTCRAAAGACDQVETCGGSSANCPSDAKRVAVQCRAASGGTCDIAESCDGVSNDCPVDGFAPSTSEVCAPYRCTGTSGPCTSGACSSDGDCATASYCVAGVCQKGKRIFVTSTQTNGNIGGLAGADAICQARALSAGLSGTYKAWLSVAGTSAASRLSHASVPYYKRSTSAVVKLAANWTELVGLVFGIPAAPVNYDENGASRSGSAAWTATLPQGTSSSGPSCTNWTATTGYGRAGSTDEPSTPLQTQYWTEWNDWLCTSLQRLYCVEQ